MSFILILSELSIIDFDLNILRVESLTNHMTLEFFISNCSSNHFNEILLFYCLIIGSKDFL